jgi:hypothetical protein
MSSINQPKEVPKPSYSIPVDSQKGKAIKLTLEINPEAPVQAEEFEAVAAMHPTSIQDFLIRLNEVLKQK